MPDRLRKMLAGHVEAGLVPGLVALLRRGGGTHAIVLGAAAADGGAPMRRDALFRIASLTKPMTAAAAMTLVEDGTLRLDDPVGELLPELAAPRVLRRPDGPLDDTVPAERAITVRDLLTFRLGTGAVLGPSPLGTAMDAAGVAPGPDVSPLSPDAWMERLGALPLAHQPGERWMYHTGAEVLGVLIARAAGRPLADVLRERILGPLGMHDTGFHVAPGDTDRLVPSYAPDDTGGLVVRDDPRDRPPGFPSGGGGLVATTDDVAAFFGALLDGGGPILSRESVRLMTSDHLTAAQRAAAEPMLGTSGWGFGVAVETRDEPPASRPGRFGWMGGLGTTAFADPVRNVLGVLCTQVAVWAPGAQARMEEFWELAG